MTLVGLDDGSSNLVSMMLSVQSQSQYHSSQSSLAHRGNVIVANHSSDLASKMQQPPSQQSQQHKKKMYAAQSASYSAAGPQPASVARRNARERNRVKQVNNGFATLRQHIPQSLAQALGSNTAGTHGGARAGSKKLSKVETLRMAVEYIRNLQQLLDEHDAELGASSNASSSGLGSPARSLSQPADLKFELKSESGDEHYQQQVSPQRQSPVYLPAACSEASSSPTPSFASDTSSAGAPTQNYGANFTTAIYPADPYDNYEPVSPEDKVLLDYISSTYMWPQSQ